MGARQTSDTIAYTYDELGRVVQRTINGSANQVDWTFDALGRVTSEENLLGEFTYTYDGVTNRLATVTYPNGQTSAYSYFDDANDHRLQTIHHKYPNASTLSKFDYTYDAVGNILTWRQQADSTAVLWRYGYDAADQLTSAVKHATDTPQTILQRFAYAYDPAGNRTVEQIDDAVTLSAYDNLNRLTSQIPGGPMVIAGTLNEPGTVTISGHPAMVDVNNNFRGTVPTTIGTNAFTITARDATGNTTTQQYEVDVAGSGRSFTYDANGNLTSDGTRSFGWNAQNQMDSFEEGTVRIDLAYDGQQRRSRVTRAVNSVTTSDVGVVWCESSLCEDRGWSDGSAQRRRFRSGEQLAGSNRLRVVDHLASPVQITDSTGAVLSQYAYDPWGRQAVVAGSGILTDGYAGYEAAAESLLLTQYRTYGAELGRWTSEDPAGFVDGPNLYAYVNSRPTVLFDPFGLSASGKTIECGPCMIRVDNDPHKGKHAHWWCKNGSTGCVKPDGSGCEGSGPPPNRVRECLRNHRFFVEPKPILSCDQNCQNVLLLAGAVAASAILTCVFKYPILVPALR